MTSVESKIVLQKVRKLLALATGNSNQNEANLAMGVAMKILESHRLTMADVTASITERTCVYVAKTRITWKHLLLGYVAEANGCCLLVAQYPDRIEANVAGCAFDIETVTTLFAWLVVEFERLANDGKYTGSARLQFLQGAATGIGAQLEEAISETRETADAYAIVLVDQRLEKLKADLIKSMGVKKRKIKSSIHNEKAASAGFNEGKTMHLGKKLGTSTGKIDEESVEKGSHVQRQ